MYPNQSNALMGGGGGGGTAQNPSDVHMDSMQNSPQQQHQQQQNLNYNGMQQQQQVQQTAQQTTNAHKKLAKKAYVRIVEQPASKALRFRYECEGRSAGSIPGVNSTSDTKTFPTIEIVGYKGRAVVVVSCVTKDAPHRPHPHNLVGKEGCKKGVCTLEINSETMRAVFSNLGIQCVKKKDIEAALKAREDIRVDPFKTGFSHRFQPTTIDLNSVRLCFQVFLEGEKGRFTVPLAPVVSEPIFDKKAMSDLVICHLCSCAATVMGNTQIILLCEKVAKEDIMVRFYEEQNGQVIWQAFGDFQHTDVHKQVAIKFKTPKYRTLDIIEPAKVFIQLQRPSDGAVSEPLPFEYMPLDSDPENLRRKRQRTGGDPTHLLMQQQQQNHNHQGGGPAAMTGWNAPNMPPIKTEPRDTSPQPFNMYRPPTELTPSPQPLSPANNYNHNTPSPYSMATGGSGGGAGGVGVGAGAPLMSPNHHYRGGDAANVGTTPTPVDTMQRDYHAFGGGGGGQPHHSPHHQQHPMQQQQHHTSPQHHQQHHQPQHLQQQHQHQQHPHQEQQYYGNPFVDIAQWEEKFANVLASANANANANTNNVGNVMNNLSANNPFNVQTLLAASVAVAAAGGGADLPAHSQWNFPPNQMHAQMQQQQKLQQSTQVQQQQQQPQYNNNNMNIVEPASDATTNANANETNNIDDEGNNAEQGPTISNLLNFDSGQLVHINSEDQQMIRLTSDDLQLSNLSIST